MERYTSGRRIVGDERALLAETYRSHYGDGWSIRRLAEASGRSYGFVHRLLAESGVTLRSRGGDRKQRQTDT